MGTVYVIINLINGKKYIGSTTNFSRRKYEHLYDLRNGNHHSPHLQRTYDKYGEENFVFNILEKDIEYQKLGEREQFYLDKYKTYKKEIGYNIHDKVSAFNTNPQYCKKVYQYDFSGNLIKIWNSCNETERLGNFDAGLVSATCLEQYRFHRRFIFIYEDKLDTLERRVKEANTNKVSLETRAKMRAKKLGLKHSEEMKRKQSKLMKGKTPKNLQSIQKLRRKITYLYDIDKEQFFEFESLTQARNIYPMAHPLGKFNKKHKIIVSYDPINLTKYKIIKNLKNNNGITNINNVTADI